jgi:hypothetical protein
LVVGGDALDPQVIGKVLRENPPQHLLNGYGPTETTTFAATYRIERIVPGKSIPIGRPIANTQIYILDSRLQPVPIGVAGELYIGGAGVARGYLNRPDLTAERVLRDPFNDKPGSTMYKTGDLGRYLADGNIEYLGRNDFQVKIRGFRIELGEIEAKLAAIDGVREAIVLAREDQPGHKRLVAYVVAQEGYAMDAVVLRATLAQELADYMLPSAFVMLAALPLTSNGKVDRKALPVPDMRRSEVGYVAPRTATEEALARIWEETLKLDKVGLHDNFFALGGHSLLATQVISKVRVTFKVDLPLRAIFEATTVACFADKIDKITQEATGTAILAIMPVDREAALPVSFSQQGLWFLHQLEPDSAFYSIPGALKLTGSLKVDALRRSLNEIVRRHEVLRTVFATVDGVPTQVIACELAGPGRSSHTVRSDCRPADSRRPASAGTAKAYPAGDFASHRLRRLVDGGAGQ